MRRILAQANLSPVHQKVTHPAVLGLRDAGPVLPNIREPTSAYIHLPFCKKRCFYCDFPVAVVGKHHEAPAIQDSMEVRAFASSLTTAHWDVLIIKMYMCYSVDTMSPQSSYVYGLGWQLMYRVA